MNGYQVFVLIVYGEAAESIKFKNVFKGFMHNEGRLQYVLGSKNHRKWSNGKFYFIIKDIFMQVLSILFFLSKQEIAGMRYLPRS